MRRVPSFLLGTTCAVAALLLGLFWTQPPMALLHAQGIDAQSAARDRDRMYDEIARDVALLEQHASVLKRVAQVVAPTVVHIEARKDERFSERFGGRFVEEAGSGVVIAIDGSYYVLTNRHVIKDAENDRIDVKLSDRRVVHPARVWSDPGTDVAVMLIDAEGLVAARLGDSSVVEIGEFVLAVGSPFGLSHSVTYGIISAKGRRDLELGDDGVELQDFMQTDAAINPGNSGGPLINLRGEVVGINTAIASNSGGNEGIGFSIPINMVRIVASQLIEYGTLRRAFLGVKLDPQFDAEAAALLGLDSLRGARVTRVTADSPADAAGLQADDVVLEYEGQAVEDDVHLVNLVNLTPVGAEVQLLVLRDGSVITLTVVLGSRDEFLPPQASRGGGNRWEQALAELEAWDVESLGLTVVEATPDACQRLQLPGDASGLIVLRVDPEGPGAQQVAPGEILQQINRVPLEDIDDLEQAMSGVDLRQPLRLRVALPRAAAAPSGTARIVMVVPDFSRESRTR